MRMPILAILLAAAGVALQPATVRAQGAVLVKPGESRAVIGAAEAHEKASKGELVLVDIRHPEEWKETGVPASGHAITMHQKGSDFLTKLAAATGGDTSRPVAIICATGSRTSFLQGPLAEVGFKAVLDVSEGMMGSRAGKGWLKAGLPVRKFAAGAEAPVGVARQ